MDGKHEKVKVRMAAKVELLSTWVSPFGLRVQIALEEKGVPHEYHEEDLGNKSERLLRANPVFKKIPVLVHNGRTIAESNIIVQYIDEAWPGHGSLMPTDPYDRAQARFWADFLDKKLYENAVALIWRKEGEEQEEGRKNFLEYLGFLEGVLGDKPYFGGDDFGFLDIAFVPFTSWFKALETVGNFTIPVEKDYPKISKWMKKCREKQSVQKVLPDSEKIVEFLTVLRKSVLG
eukprot:TRINITY_DN179_c0_g1_i2.p1 TRINITY_DN179_c0_g1~~TRINITY_DN179_c0_g1_i2.p1  ORF type:complete len:233 (-),score=48.19 TRINITY_DN179_c0_g1_i2:175-873(-)